MANPPSVVKMALESICTLLGEKGDTWKGIRSVVMKDNFISTIVNFETENITLVAAVSKVVVCRVSQFEMFYHITLDMPCFFLLSYTQLRMTERESTVKKSSNTTSFD